MPRVYKRLFDWDEAARLRAEGLTYKEIGRRLGVSDSAIRLAVLPERRRKASARVSEWQKSGTCPDCAGRASRNSLGQKRCLACAGKARRTRFREDGTVRCMRCKQWKPRSEFPRGTKADGLHGECRSCQTEIKREWREKNRERERAYDRERKRALRQKVAA